PPCPISKCLLMTVNHPRRSLETHWGRTPLVVDHPRQTRAAETGCTDPARRRRQPRHPSAETCGGKSGSSLPPPLCERLRRVVNGSADADICAAAADVALHPQIDVGVGRF